MLYDPLSTLSMLVVICKGRVPSWHETSIQRQFDIKSWRQYDVIKSSLSVTLDDVTCKTSFRRCEFDYALSCHWPPQWPYSVHVLRKPCLDILSYLLSKYTKINTFLNNFFFGEFVSKYCHFAFRCGQDRPIFLEPLFSNHIYHLNCVFS